MALRKYNKTSRCEMCDERQPREEYCLDIRYCRSCVYDNDLSPDELVPPDRSWRIPKTVFEVRPSQEETYTKARTKYKQYKYQAKQRDVSFSLDFDTILNLPDSECWYCGDQATNCNRKDLSGGWTDENTVPACKLCALSRQGRTQEEFFTHIHQIAQRHPKRS